MICINVVNIHLIITGKHDPTMSGKHRPAIDSFFPLFPYLLLYRTEEDAGSSPARSTNLSEFSRKILTFNRIFRYFWWLA